MELRFGEYMLRGWRRTDTESVAKYANNKRLWINLSDRFPHPYTEKDAIEFIGIYVEELPLRHFAIATDQEAIGSIGFHPGEDVYRRSAEIGYWLGEPWWGKGIATQALKKLVEYAFTNFDLVRLYAGVFEWNPASMRVLEKAGFRLEARLRKSIFKDGKIIDSVRYVLLKDDWATKTRGR